MYENLQNLQLLYDSVIIHVLFSLFFFSPDREFFEEGMIKQQFMTL